MKRILHGHYFLAHPSGVFARWRLLAKPLVVNKQNQKEIEEKIMAVFAEQGLDAVISWLEREVLFAATARTA